MRRETLVGCTVPPASYAFGQAEHASRKDDDDSYDGAQLQG